VPLGGLELALGTVLVLARSLTTPIAMAAGLWGLGTGAILLGDAVALWRRSQGKSVTGGSSVGRVVAHAARVSPGGGSESNGAAERVLKQSLIASDSACSERDLIQLHRGSRIMQRKPM
jgi:hypothetical protein